MMERGIHSALRWPYQGAPKSSARWSGAGQIPAAMRCSTRLKQGAQWQAPCGARKARQTRMPGSNDHFRARERLPKPFSSVRNRSQFGLFRHISTYFGINPILFFFKRPVKNAPASPPPAIALQRREGRLGDSVEWRRVAAQFRHALLDSGAARPHFSSAAIRRASNKFFMNL